ncbi:MAG: KR domain-containing protein, partial [Planctomycetaceae bacterium]
RGLDDEQLRGLKRDLAIRARQENRSPADAWRQIEKAMELERNLGRFAKRGVRATYHACDLCDRDSLAVTLQRIRKTDGPIIGVLHGAGIESACRLVRKKMLQVQATIAAKCDGAANLISLTADDLLQFFVAFGSTSGRFGGLGQADYSLASDLLAKMMDRLAVERPDCRSLCFHWPAWDEVGMAVRPESKMALQAGGVSFMPVAEGVTHLLNELQSGTREREILILDKPEPLDTDRTMTRNAAPADPREFADASSAGEAVATSPPRETHDDGAASAVMASSSDPCASLPLMDRLVPGIAAGQYLAELHLDAARDPFLAEHRFRGKPLLPIVMALELFAEAVMALRPSTHITAIRDVRIINPCYVDPKQVQPAQVCMRETNSGIACELVGPFYDSNGKQIDSERLYVSGTLETGDAARQLEAIQPGKPLFDWFPFLYPEDLHIYHGRPFRTLLKIDYIHGGGRAVLKAKPTTELVGTRTGTGMFTAPALVDGCLVACGTWGYIMLEQALEIPAGLECYRQSRSPREGEQCILRFFLREQGLKQNRYDMVLVGEAGDTILQIEGYRANCIGENS